MPDPGTMAGLGFRWTSPENRLRRVLVSMSVKAMVAETPSSRRRSDIPPTTPQAPTAPASACFFYLLFTWAKAKSYLYRELSLPCWKVARITSLMSTAPSGIPSPRKASYTHFGKNVFNTVFGSKHQKQWKRIDPFAQHIRVCCLCLSPPRHGSLCCVVDIVAADQSVHAFSLPLRVRCVTRGYVYRAQPTPSL